MNNRIIETFEDYDVAWDWAIEQSELKKEIERLKRDWVNSNTEKTEQKIKEKQEKIRQLDKKMKPLKYRLIRKTTLTISDALSGYQMITILKQRFPDVTDEEIAMWVSLGGIHIFSAMLGERTLVLESLDPNVFMRYELGISAKTLLCYYRYSRTEVEAFDPETFGDIWENETGRFLTYRQVIGTLTNHSDEATAVAIVEGEFFTNRMKPLHYILGTILPSDEFLPLEQALFSRQWLVAVIETDFNIDSETQVPICEPLGQKVKTKRGRRTRITIAVEEAYECLIANLKRKPTIDEVMNHLEHHDKTGFIVDAKPGAIVWVDTKGEPHQTKGKTIQNLLSKLRNPK